MTKNDLIRLADSLENGEVVAVSVWGIEDVEDIRLNLYDSGLLYADVTLKDKLATLKLMEKQEDAEIGFTWDVLKSCLFQILENKNNANNKCRREVWL